MNAVMLIIAIIPECSYLLIYSSLFIATIAFYSYGLLFYYFRGLRASRVINAQLIDSVFGSTLRSVIEWFHRIVVLMNHG